MKSKKRTKKHKKVQKYVKRYKKTKKQKGGAVKELSSDNITFVRQYVLKESRFKKIHNRYLYTCTIDNCTYYFDSDDDITSYAYIILKIDNTLYLVINENNENSDISRIRAILNADNFNIKQLSSYNYYYKKLTTCVNNRPELPNTINDEIDSLNVILQSKKNCDNYKLRFDYMYNLDGTITTFSDNINYLVLCLYRDDQCISSVEFVFKVGYIEINLNTLETYTNQYGITHNGYEGRNYMKLLCAAAIIISKCFEVGTIKAVCVNPISAYLLIHYLNGEMDENHEDSKEFIKFYMEKKEKIKNEIGKNRVTFNDMPTSYYINYFADKTNIGIPVYIELSDENIKNAREIFKETINGDKFRCN